MLRLLLGLGLAFSHPLAGARGAPGAAVAPSVRTAPPAREAGSGTAPAAGQDELRSILEALRSERAGERADALDRLGRVGPGARLAERAVAGLLAADPAPRVRARAARALPLVGAAPEVAVPALVGALDDPSRAVRGAAARALAGYGDAALAALDAALAAGERAALLGLGACGSAGRARLVAALEVPGLGATAVEVLQELGDDGEAGLVAALGRPDLRALALRALRRLGAGRPRIEAEPESVRTLPEGRVKRAAVWTLKGGAPAAVPTAELLAWAADPDPAWAELGLWLLGRRGPAALAPRPAGAEAAEPDPVGAALAGALAAEAPALRRTAAWALGALNGAGAVWRLDVVPGAGADLGPHGGIDLAAEPGSPGRGLRGRPLAGLRREFVEAPLRPAEVYRPRPEEVPDALRAAVEALAARLDDADPGVRRAAAWALAQAGPWAGAAQERLVAGLVAPPGDAAAAADRGAEGRARLEALLALQVPPAELWTALAPVLAAPDTPTRALGLEALAEVELPAARERLRAALAGADPVLAEAAVRALERAGAAAADAPALAAALPAGRLAAAGLLAGLGPAGVEPLADALDAPAAEVRAVAALALAHIGPAAEPARARLAARVERETDRLARQAARQALAALGGGR